MTLRKRIAKFPPVLTAFVAQIFAGLISVTGLRLLGLHLTVGEFVFASGTLAVLISYWARMALWWLPIQLFFLPAIYLATSWNLPSWVYFALFLALLAVYWSTFRTQVPLYLSSQKVWHALESVLPSQSNDFKFIDIGCGMGGILTHLAKARPDAKFHGVEYAPLPFLASWLRVKLSGQPNCDVQWGSLWDADLSQFDVVYAYLSPVPMEELWNKVRREMKPGTLFISNTFAVPGQKPDRLVQVDDLHQSTLYIWQL